VARISVETLTVFSSIPVTQMPGIQLSLAQGNGVLRTDLGEKSLLDARRTRSRRSRRDGLFRHSVYAPGIGEDLPFAGFTTGDD